ncbi:MAG: type II toxin-antitoxin system Phd/YefM family antitoxin [Phycisphaerales bacterium]|nr:MAG: type II toxin-antitoxin system Phd/YefM family antitoxin [Phycisphaerales bacterium]
MTRTSDITNFTELRQNLRDHLNHVKETGRLLYVTSDGVAEAVVLSAKAFDELADRADLGETLAMIGLSEAEFRAGKGVEARGALLELAKKHGLNITS